MFSVFKKKEDLLENEQGIQNKELIQVKDEEVESAFQKQIANDSVENLKVENNILQEKAENIDEKIKKIPLVELDKIDIIKKFIRAANYISAAQIYLKDNAMLERSIIADDIKPRLLGHWGTAPGINFAYAHINSFLVDQEKANKKVNSIFLLGPGHGFAALQANLFLEGSLQKYYPDIDHSGQGLQKVIREFSWPYGFPSHSSPATPGVIVEGGELGYALSTAYGAVLDNPETVAFCMVGDGEAETGPTAASWHLNKLMNPRESGFVLPILHLNGYKISGPTIFARMSETDLRELFSGYGYEVHFVESEDIEDNKVHEAMQQALQKSFAKFEEIRNSSDEELHSVKFPMIVLRTPKGWTGIKEDKGLKIEGNALSHQVLLPNSKINDEDRKKLEAWLRGYEFNELFDKDYGLKGELKSIIPSDAYKMGENPITFGGKVTKDLILPQLEDLAKNIEIGITEASTMKGAGEYMSEVFRLNKENKNFRLFSPDETYSNKVDSVFKETARAWRLRIESWDKDMALDGRVMEILSEHCLQGMLQGYVLTGRHGVFPSYEAFLQVIASMADQYAKFIRIASELKWRGDVPSINYYLTSPGWRQEHNGFSHQNPGFIDTVMQKHGDFVRVYFPVDYNTNLVVLEKCLKSKNGMNLIVAGKSDEPQWMNLDDARRAVEEGVSIWSFISDDNPDIVFAACGDYLTKETMLAVQFLKKVNPKIKIRFVNILELSAFCSVNYGICNIDKDRFEEIFTKDKPIIFNFHGYPDTLKQVIFDYKDSNREIIVHGYMEVGSTTTALDMHVRNKTSRYDLARDTYTMLAKTEVVTQKERDDFVKKIDELLFEHKKYITEYGSDMSSETVWQKWGQA